MNGTQLFRDIPLQFATQSETRFFKSLANVVKPVKTGYFSSDLVLNSILAQAFQKLWSLVTVHQIIILMPLFEVILPPSAEAVFKVLF